MIKKEELFLGAWVLFGTRPVRIDGIAEGGFSVHLSKGQWVPLCDVSPIALTPEILEKNGFVSCQFWHEYKDGNIAIQACLPSIRMKNGPCELEIKECVHYVHQLQSALRFCGIDKEIIL